VCIAADERMLIFAARVTGLNHFIEMKLLNRKNTALGFCLPQNRIVFGAPECQAGQVSGTAIGHEQHRGRYSA
jgi:hypothetical protein